MTPRLLLTLLLGASAITLSACDSLGDLTGSAPSRAVQLMGAVDLSQDPTYASVDPRGKTVGLVAEGPGGVATLARTQVQPDGTLASYFVALPPASAVVPLSGAWVPPTQPGSCSAPRPTSGAALYSPETLKVATGRMVMDGAQLGLERDIHLQGVSALGKLGGTRLFLMHANVAGKLGAETTCTDLAGRQTSYVTQVNLMQGWNVLATSARDAQGRVLTGAPLWSQVLRMDVAAEGSVARVP